MAKLSVQEALVYLMVIMSASDRDMGDEELARIGAIVRTLPVFRGFDQARTLLVAQDCQKALAEEGGFQAVLDDIAGALSQPLRETGYAVAVDIAAADSKIRLEEDRVLDIFKSKLAIDALAAASIERAAAIRHRTA
ncbi:tellurite resistance TerB family protein [Aliihoeflea sp. PC F10.4]